MISETETIAAEGNDLKVRFASSAVISSNGYTVLTCSVELGTNALSCSAGTSTQFYICFPDGFLYLYLGPLGPNVVTAPDGTTCYVNNAIALPA